MHHNAPDEFSITESKCTHTHLWRILVVGAKCLDLPRLHVPGAHHNGFGVMDHFREPLVGGSVRVMEYPMRVGVSTSFRVVVVKSHISCLQGVLHPATGMLCIFFLG